jgi:hypothetical protein
MTDLPELARKWTTDKALYYAAYYEQLFRDRRDSVKRLLEFGIGYPELMLKPAARAGARTYICGASLFMWEEYFPNAEIFAVDNREDILINSGRIHSFWADQSEDTNLRNLFRLFLGRKFDIVIDDGSHEPNNQIRTAKICFDFKMLAPDGLYIIEDAPPHDADFLLQLPRKVEAIDFDENPNDPARLVVIRP